MPNAPVRLVTLGLALMLLAGGCIFGETSDDGVADSTDVLVPENTTVAVAPTATVAPAESAAEPEPVEPEPVEPEPAEPEPAEPEPAEPAAVDTGDGLFPTVVAVDASTSDGTTWRFNVTLLSEYDSPQRYADAWRVLDADDNELGIRVLGHDHAGEQPFTRSTDVDIADQVTTVFVEGRDQVNGWSGERFEVMLER